MLSDEAITGSYRSRRAPRISGWHLGVAAAKPRVRRRRPREGEQPAGCDQIDGAERSTGKLDAEDREELADVYGDRTDEHGAARIIHSVGRNTGPGTWRSGARRCLSLDQAGERARDAA